MLKNFDGITEKIFGLLSFATVDYGGRISSNTEVNGFRNVNISIGLPNINTTLLNIRKS